MQVYMFIGSIYSMKYTLKLLFISACANITHNTQKQNLRGVALKTVTKKHLFFNKQTLYIPNNPKSTSK